MPLSRGNLAALLLLTLNICSQAWGETETRPMHWSSKQTLWNRKTEKVELNGEAVVNMPGETIRADKINLDLNERTLDAYGSCEYKMGETLIRSDEMHFHLDARTGSIVGGSVTDGKYLLKGERINKLSDKRFQTHRAEYTTCLDCPSFWAFQGDDVDFELEGYATMTNFKAKWKDRPFLWFPYMIIPIKSKRQSGLLFPSFRLGGLHGVSYLQKFFWATGRSTDMTLGAGLYSIRGTRFDWEGRYVLGGMSRATANIYYLKDKTGRDNPHRYAAKLDQIQKFPFGIEEKLRIYEVSDIDYPVQFPEDIPGYKEPALASDVIFSYGAPNISVQATGRRYRNLLNFDEPTAFDPRTVQLYPRVNVSVNDLQLWRTPIVTGINFGLTNFTRTADFFDYDATSTFGDPYRAGIDPIREATRFHFTPKMYIPFRAWDALMITPSVEYRGYYYALQQPVSDLVRGYLLFKTDFSFQIEKVYDRPNDPEIPALKHLIRPTFTYARIPYILKSDHPFLNQIDYKSGYQFDNEDIVPITTTPSLLNYFIPLGNSFTYGATTQLIRKRGVGTDSTLPAYQRSVELSAGQTLNLLELDRDESVRVPWSRFYLTNELVFDAWNWRTQYYYYPNISRLPGVTIVNPSPHEVTTGLQYSFAKKPAGSIFDFERSISLSYTRSRITSFTEGMGIRLAYSLNDYIMPIISSSINFASPTKFQEARAQLYLQHSSRCIRFIAETSYSVATKAQFGVGLEFNLTGSGYGNVSSFAPAGS